MQPERNRRGHSMTDDQFEHIVEEVVRRLVRRMRTAGDTGRLIVVFTGATVAFGEAVQQVRSLLLDGFRVQTVFSPAAEHLLGDAVEQGLDGFQHVDRVPEAKWLSSLKEATCVVVPLLSLSSVSKLSSLIADNLAGNILLHALLMGKPLILARDGADPDSGGRAELGFHRANEVLKEAMRQRLQTLEDYGCILTSTSRLASAVRSLTLPGGSPERREHSLSPVRLSVRISGRVATSGDVLHAQQKGADLDLGPVGRLTPLARDLARRLGVTLITGEKS